MFELKEWNDPVPPTVPNQHADVDYTVVTPNGSRARFQRTLDLIQMHQAQSETAVSNFLRMMHPGTEIQIQRLVFKP